MGCECPWPQKHLGQPYIRQCDNRRIYLCDLAAENMKKKGIKIQYARSRPAVDELLLKRGIE
jgi:hypothetical protein